MSSTYPQRVAFEDHRFVRAVDLEDEQLYHLQRRWQHNLGLHSWGILCGQEVRNIGGTLRQPVVIIHKGLALDGYGRELVVTDVLRVLRPDETLDPAVTYDVWLTYNIGVDNGGSDPVDDCHFPESDYCCSPPDMNLRRIVEQPQILLRHTSARQSGSVTQPREVPAGDLDFSPERPMKFDAVSPWPVFLCKLECNGTVWNIDSTERHYGGLITERIEVPYQTLPPDSQSRTRGTAILNGGHPDRKDWRFAVLDVPDPQSNNDSKNKQKAKPHRIQTLPDDVPAPLSIRAITRADSTDTEIRWQAERVVAEADVVMRGGAGLQFEATPVGEIPIPPTTGWGIYRNFRPPAEDMGPNEKGDPQPPNSNASQFADVLQISMPDTDKGHNSVAIGAVDADGKFAPILVVNNDDSVDINGVLRVHGVIHGITSDLPPLNRARALEKLIERLPNAMKDSAVTSQLKQDLVTAVAKGSEASEIFSGIKRLQIRRARFPMCSRCSWVRP